MYILALADYISSDLTPYAVYSPYNHCNRARGILARDTTCVTCSIPGRDPASPWVSLEQCWPKPKSMVSCQNWGPYPPCLRMADRALLARYPRIVAPINSFPPRQNGCHFADEIFRRIFVNEKFCTLIKVSLEFVPERPIKIHWGRVTHICAWSAPSHFLNQCWDIVNWILRNKRQWNFNRYSSIFIQENAFENVFNIGSGNGLVPSAKWRPFCLGLNVLTMDQHWFR